MIMPMAQAGDVISFGPFSLVASEKLLTRAGTPVELSTRALDILIALVSRPYEAMSKKDLLARVWPGAAVHENSLRVQIANLRNALGDGTNGARYIVTLAGKGYCFVAPLSRSGDQGNASPETAISFPHANLPSPLFRMVGRDDDVLRLSNQLTAARFVTIVGTGGIGKTTVAVAVGRHLSVAFADAVLFVDLGTLSDPGLVATFLASMLSLSVQSEDATPNLVAYLRDKRILLILDTCEHLVDAVAALAARIVAAAPQVHILATSREALQVEAEHVYRLDPLACPPDDKGLTAAVAHRFPATQLFMDRALASGARMDFSDLEAVVVASICRKLDGVALAIELAARRVETYGLAETAALLDQRLALLWIGRRTAPPRQKTLQATLDWSYGLLSELERIVLRRLAVFVGHFSLDAALAVVTSADVDQSLVFGAIDSLVAKSMVVTHPIGTVMRYRLLDTTRAYALETDVADAEQSELRIRHAAYYRQWLEKTGTDWPTLSSGAERVPHFAALNNVRAALEWCFGTNGNVKVGVKLASAAAPAFLAMSLLSECHRWSERAILALDDATLGGLDEMHLQAALGLSLNFMRGEISAAGVALNRSLAIAEERGNALDQVRLLPQLQMFCIRSGDFNTARHYGMRCSVIARTIEDVEAVALAHFFLGSVFHFMGDLGAARVELEAALKHERSSRSSTTISFGFDGRNLVGAILARNLWLQGHPAQAAERARRTIEIAARADHSLTLCIALILCVNVFFWNGDLETAEEYIDWLISRSETYFLAPYLAAGRGFRGALAIHRGDMTDGVEDLKGYLEQLHYSPYTLLNIALVQGLAATDRFAEGTATIDETIRMVEASGELAHMPELLRVKGNLLLSMPQPSIDAVQACFMQSLELSRVQGAKAWELRTATDLAKLWASQGRADDAKALLRPVFGQFSEGLDTPDLKAAERLLAAIS
ncbi:ATP-binding protein [Bradyrhizobium genosp. A]|uniref:ATP-binding protein n=1 Tax=Bradyrhizobium genosp. A TaxID=83626 RepID=UPI003CF0232E